MNDLLLFVGIFAVVALAGAAKKWMAHQRAEGWSQATGRIESGEVSGIRSYPGGKSTFTATVNYSYSVNGEWLAGSAAEKFNDEQKAWDFVEQHKGKEILVRYNPDKPGSSVIWQILGGEIYAR